MKIDRYYTPARLAKKMVWSVEKKQRGYIADFACGTGQLLSAASKRWPKSRLVATDICKSTITSLRRREPRWNISQCDFIKDSSRNRCKTINNIEDNVSLALLNPPFSCRGSSRVKTVLGDEIVYSSIAMAFVLNSTRYLTKNGQIIAILPQGCLNNDRDKHAWKYLQNIGQVEIIRANGHRIFAGCSARTVIMRFSKMGNNQPGKELHRKYNNTIDGKLTIDMQNIRMTLIRGNIPMYSINGNQSKKFIPLIHSTELQNGSVLKPQHSSSLIHKQISGTFILLPRVGKPKKSKIALYRSKIPFTISDCVMAIRCANMREAKKAYQRLFEHWHHVEERYNGTCARHITIRSLGELLQSLGFQVNT